MPGLLWPLYREAAVTTFRIIRTRNNIIYDNVSKQFRICREIQTVFDFRTFYFRTVRCFIHILCSKVLELNFYRYVSHKRNDSPLPSTIIRLSLISFPTLYLKKKDTACYRALYDEKKKKISVNKFVKKTPDTNRSSICTLH